MAEKPDASPAPLFGAEDHRNSTELEDEERDQAEGYPPPREIGLSFRSSSLKSDIKSDLQDYQSAIDTYDLVIRFKDINVNATSFQQAQSYETFGKKFLGCFLAPLKMLQKKPEAHSFKVLDNVSGYIMPGSMTLLLGPTGSGKSTLLKVLAGHFQATKLAKLDGEVLYNDSVLTPDLRTRRPIAFITGLHNVHLPLFTVRETLQFVEECTRRQRAEALISELIKCFTPDLMDAENPYLEYILQTTGLKYIENFMVGVGDTGLKDSARVRLTTAEIAMQTFSVMLYDQPVTAEDSLRLYDRLHNLLNTIIKVQECALVSCLVQVSPEVYELFDRIILLSEGQVIYQGPRHCVESYFSKLGFERPAFVDPAVFLQDIAAGAGGRYLKPGSPLASLESLVGSYQTSDHLKDIQRIISSKSVIHAYWIEVVSDIELSIQDTPEGSRVFVTNVSDAEEVATNGAIRVGDEITAIITSDGHIHYINSSISSEERALQAQRVLDLLNSKQRPVYVQLERKMQKMKDEKGACYKRELGKFSLGDWLWATRCLLNRQVQFTLRFKLLYMLRIFQIILLGLFAGTMFYKKGGKIDQFEMISLRTIGFISMMNLLLINFIQLPIHVLMNRPVFHKHRLQKLFPVSSYVVAHCLVNFPQSFVEAFLYSMCTYFLAGLSLVTAAHYFQYLALIVLIAYMGSSFVFLVGGFAPIVESALALAGLFVLVCILFSGVIVLPSVMPKYWRWMMYIAPMRWGNIIFSSTQMKDRYPQPCTNYPIFQFCLVAPRLNVGKAFLKFYELDATTGRLLLSYGAIIIFTLAVNILTYFVYKKTRMPDLVASSRRGQPQQIHVHEDEEDDELNKAENGAPIKRESGWPTLSLPVRPLALTFQDLSLIQLGQPRLKHVSGYAKPGEMLALLGSTRAGKTTLLNCLAGRPEGKLEGRIMVNGVELKKTCFHRISGFAEKLESHQPYLTVRESLEFSANLRLRRHVTPAEKSRHVDEVLELTGLSQYSNLLVGSFQDLTSRTKETTKKLTIAVELAANPSILFLDDPSSQLDSIGTRNILHMLRAVALNGRALIFTLHHPSGETLSLFDNVLVLQQGEQVFYGPPGRNGSKLLEYFTSIPNVPAYDGKRSPVVFMLDILGGGTWKRDPAADFAAAYRSSPLHGKSSAEIEAIQSQQDDLRYDSRYIAPLSTQVKMVFLRNLRFLYRNVKYTFSRLTGIIIIALVMGTIFLNIDMERSKSMQSGSLIMYIQAILICATTANNLIPQLGTDRQVYVRESRARMYASILYPLSWLASEIPYILLATILFVGITNGMAGIGVDDFSMFARYTACLFLFTVVIVCYGIFLACAAPLPTIGVTFASIFTSVWISASGISVPRHHIKFYKWLYWLDPFQYTMNILIPASFYCDTKSPACVSCSTAREQCPGCSCKRLYDVERLLSLRSNSTRPASFVWDRLLATRPIERDRNHWDYLALFAIAFFFAALAATSFRFLKHNRAS